MDKLCQASATWSRINTELVVVFSLGLLTIRKKNYNNKDFQFFFFMSLSHVLHVKPAKRSAIVIVVKWRYINSLEKVMELNKDSDNGNFQPPHVWSTACGLLELQKQPPSLPLLPLMIFWQMLWWGQTVPLYCLHLAVNNGWRQVRSNNKGAAHIVQKYKQSDILIDIGPS